MSHPDKLPTPMTPAEYQKLTQKTNNYPKRSMIHDLILGLTSEAGEVAGKLKKKDRDKIPYPKFRHSLIKELGDCMWYISEICNQMDFDLEGIMASNILKLQARDKKGTLGGDGDDR